MEENDKKMDLVSKNPKLKSFPCLNVATIWNIEPKMLRKTSNLLKQTRFCKTYLEVLFLMACCKSLHSFVGLLFRRKIKAFSSLFRFCHAIACNIALV